MLAMRYGQGSANKQSDTNCWVSMLHKSISGTMFTLKYILEQPN